MRLPCKPYVFCKHIILITSLQHPVLRCWSYCRIQSGTKLYLFFSLPFYFSGHFFFLFSCSFSPLSSSSDVTPVTPVTPCYIPYTFLLQPCYTLIHPFYTLLHPGYTQLHPPLLPVTNHLHPVTTLLHPVTPCYTMSHPLYTLLKCRYTLLHPWHTFWESEGNDWTWVQ